MKNKDCVKKEIFERLKKALLYGGLEKKEYQDIVSDSLEENRKNLVLYSAIGILLFGLLAIASMIVKGFAVRNQTAYVICFFLCILIHIAALDLAKSQTKMIRPLIYGFMSVLFAFSLYITTLHPETSAVTAIVMLLVLPLLFYDRPINMSAFTIAFTVVFCITVFFTKPPNVMETDLWNGLSFGALAVIVDVIIVRVRIQNIAQARRISYLGIHDLLTGLKNRNCFENDLANYAKKCGDTLACVYIDVNGLHELNNILGHRKGDIMLQTVALELRNRFGEETYRIGGDEFLVLQMDRPMDEIRNSISQIQIALEGQGYYISMGCAEARKPDIRIGQLVRNAEKEMFRAKAEYYEKNGFCMRYSNRTV